MTRASDLERTPEVHFQKLVRRQIEGTTADGRRRFVTLK